MTRILDTFAQTDVGRKREHNEDKFLLKDELGLYIVADGMGGHAAGEVASRTAINTISDFLADAEGDHDLTWPFGIDSAMGVEENLILSAVRLANREICALAEEKPEYHGMGTTIAALKIDGADAVIAHVGDSRVYRLRAGELELLTADHTWVNEQVARNLITEEEARNHRWRNVITRALGNKYTIDVEMGRADMRAGDVFLLCSDGLTGMVSDQTIHEVLKKTEGASAKALTRELVDLANEGGGLDNITVIVIRVISVDEARDNETTETMEQPPTPE